MKRIKGIVQFIRSKVNKYWVAVIVGVVATFGFGEYSIDNRISRWKQIHQLRGDIKHYTQLRDDAQQKLDELHSNDESLEKLAREQYKMVKPDEELFIIKE
jgi:cell division protein FtsB